MAGLSSALDEAHAISHYNMRPANARERADPSNLHAFDFMRRDSLLARRIFIYLFIKRLDAYI